MELQNPTSAMSELYRDDLELFIGKVFETVDPGTPYLDNWHIRMMAEHLMACARGDIKRLIINVPPRCLKSIAVSVAFPAWLLARNPSTKIMAASYAKKLSIKMSVDTRLVMKSPWYRAMFPATIISPDEDAKEKFVTTARGFRVATSVGGPATGHGADALIIDDPLNAKHAHSVTIRESANTWYDQVFSSRLDNREKGCIILIMQRLHENDLTGHLMAKGGWTQLMLPLIAEKDETITCGTYSHTRKEGDLLHPKLIPQSEIFRLKSDLSAYGFSAQYQQWPSPTGGGIFIKDWVQYYDWTFEKTDKINTYILVDPAYTSNPNSDYSAFVVIAANEDGNVYILEMIKDRLELKDREKLLFDLHKKYKPTAVHYQQYGVEGDVRHMNEAMKVRKYSFDIQVFKVAGKLKKVDRIEMLQPMFYRRKIFFPAKQFKVDAEGKTRDVIHDFIHQEYLLFPVTDHDDMLDALSMMCFIQLDYGNQKTFDYEKTFGGIQGQTFGR